MHHHSHHHCSDCTHGHAGHHHPDRNPHKVRLLLSVLILVSGFSVAELLVGCFSHSLALLADSGHMLADGLALGLALIAAWIARLPNSHPIATLNLRRVETWAALMNGLGLIAIALWIGWEAITRLQSPPTEILSLPMLATAVLGLGINSINVWLLHKDSHHDLNLKGAFLHIVADLVSSVGVILAAIAVWLMNWMWADGAISLVVSGLIIGGAIPLIVQSYNALATPTTEDYQVSQLTVLPVHEAIASRK